MVLVLLLPGIPVQSHADESPASPGTTSASTVKKSVGIVYHIRQYSLDGNTALDPATVEEILSHATGEGVTHAQIRQALLNLQIVYRERGFASAAVKLPRQSLDDGIVRVSVVEGPNSSLSSSAPVGNLLSTTAAATSPRLPAREKSAIPASPASPPAVRTFEIRHYEVVGNTLLKPEAIDKILSSATGTNVTMEQIQKAKGDLLLAYRERGYASVAVVTPPQQITNATIRIEVTEGRLVAARVTGNRFFSSNNVMRALPTVSEAAARKDQVVNSAVLQRELDLANLNRDRTIYPVLTPGPDPGTTAMELRVKDRLPLHGRVELNNDATPGTPDWRVNASLNYNNLWQREHQAGISYGFTPEEFKSEGLMRDYFFNRPLIANYGGFYRLPFGSAESVEERVNSSSQFGYDEASHQFRLPPAGARPDLTVYASGSSSDTGVKYTKPSYVGSQTNNPAILSYDSGQNLSINSAVGGRLSVPWVLSDTKRLSFSGGLDWKHSELEGYNTNNFTFLYRFHDPNLGDQTIVTESHSGQPSQRTESNYIPLGAGVSFSENDKQGNTTLSLEGSVNFIGETQISYFNIPTNANPKDYVSSSSLMDFGKLSLSAIRDQKLAAGWSLFLRANGQAADRHLISNEQFSLGGLRSVRGYYEGDQYGDAGWSESTELRTPYLATQVPGWAGDWPVWLRGSAFFDAGQSFMLGNNASSPTKSLLGVGFGVSANLNNTMDLRITVGWPLKDSANTRAGDPRAYFSLGGQF